MQGNPQVIAALNGVLKYQLTAINQSFLHARMGRNWGYKLLDRAEYKWSIKAMKHADEVIERILFLDGLPNLQELGKLFIGETVPEMLSCDEKLIHGGLADMRKAIALAESEQDYVTRDIVTEQLESEEEQLDWTETHLGLIGAVGLPNFLQSLTGDNE